MGLEAFTRSVAWGYAHLGVHCNAIRVGSIQVDHGGGDKLVGDLERTDLRTGSTDRRAAPGQPEDVAQAVRYLVSPAAKA
ncbi:SDR family oxidoreductase [Pseudonocardia sp. K10HN5]|uniref:SDR family oxidoreductase n=1 Tax=Pseudonocardia acidicola TaxID=2724939 RepID=A0ABX1SDD5_9PSEU|nr:SDR family oxidoreductase [Pseudonocardia acidicola]